MITLTEIYYFEFFNFFKKLFMNLVDYFGFELMIKLAHKLCDGALIKSADFF